MKKLITAIASLLLALAVLPGCGAPPSPTGTPTPSATSMSVYQLEYRLIAKYTDLFW